MKKLLLISGFFFSLVSIGYGQQWDGENGATTTISQPLWRTGQVGIGLSSAPTADLHLKGLLRIETKTTSSVEGINIDNKLHFYTGTSQYIKNLSSGAMYFWNSGGGDWRFRNSANNDIFFIQNSTERVGIGITNPAYKLDVNGDISTSGAYRIGDFKIFEMPGSNNLVVGVNHSLVTGGGDNGTNNTFFGQNAGKSTTTGDENTYIGNHAGTSYNGTENTFIGSKSGYSTGSGNYNTFIGSQSGNKNTSGFENVFIGGVSGYKNTTGKGNLFSGYRSGYSNEVGNYNVFLGWNSGYKSTADGNTFIGSYTGNLNTTGDQNTFIGASAGKENVTGFGNVYIGTNAGFKSTGDGNLMLGLNTGMVSTADNNIFLGKEAGKNNTSGGLNTFIGSEAGKNTTTGNQNVFIGMSAGLDNLTGVDNMFLGYHAGKENENGNRNVYIGKQAGNSATSADENTYIGNHAGYSNTETGAVSNTYIGNHSGKWKSGGIQNTYVGSGSGSYASGNSNVYMGYSAGHGPNGVGNSGSHNSFIGYRSGRLNATGTKNTFLGSNSGSENSSGGQNTFLGHNSGNKNTSGSSNTFIGNDAGNANTIGIENAFFGNNSGYRNIDGNSNAFFGANAGAFNTSGSNNMFLGSNAGNKNDSGEKNTFIGPHAGFSNVSGSNNTYIGSEAGYSAVGSGNFYLGEKAGYNTNGTNNMFLGYSAGSEFLNGEKNIILGYTAGLNSSLGGGHNILMGAHSGYSFISGDYSIFIGESSGRDAEGDQQVFIGRQAGEHSAGGNNIFIGHLSGAGTDKNSGNHNIGTDNIFIGSQTGFNNTTGLANVFLGGIAGKNNKTGRENTYLGSAAGHNSTGSYNVFIGNEAGYNETDDNKLYIANTQIVENDPSTLPLVYGEFDNHKLGINTNSLESDATLTVGGKVSATEYLVNGQPMNSSPWTVGSPDISFMSGNVGVGTASPKSNLSIANGNAGKDTDGLDNSLLYLNNGSGTDGSIVIKTHGAPENQVIGALKFHSSPDAVNYSQSAIKAIAGQYSSANALAFFTSQSNTQQTADEVMRIQGKNVGIGTATPGYKLEVNGKVKAEDFILPNGTSLATSAWTTSSEDPNEISFMTGNVGVGVENPTASLHVTASENISTSNEADDAHWRGQKFEGTVSNTSTNGSALAKYFINNDMTVDGTGTLSSVVGNHNLITLKNSSANNNVNSFVNRVNVRSDGKANKVSMISTHYEGSNNIPTNGTSVIKDLYGISIGANEYVSNFVPHNTEIINTYGLYIGGLTEGANQTGLKYSLYASDAETNNYFAGNVGIGTDQPAANLHVSAVTGDVELLLSADTQPDGDENDNPFITFMQDNKEATGFIGLVGDNDMAPHIQKHPRYQLNEATQQHELTYNYLGTLANSLFMGTNHNKHVQFGTLGNVRMTILDNGKIGIGTNAPDEKLRMDEADATKNNFVKLMHGGITDSNLLFGTASSSYAVTNHRQDNVLESYTNLHISAAKDGNIYFETGRIDANTNVRMQINKAGNVFVGSDVAEGNLYVHGNILSKEVKVDLSIPAPDYVFDDNYKLRSLKETEDYIEKNHHLPEIPSAKVMESEGVELGTMNMKLLQKIEELTLHMIEMKKDIEKLKLENEALKSEKTKKAEK